MTLDDALQQFPEGAYAAYISQILYDHQDALTTISKGWYQGKDFMEKLREWRAYFEAIAMAKLKEKSEKEFSWIWELAKMEKGK